MVLESGLKAEKYDVMGQGAAGVLRDGCVVGLRNPGWADSVLFK